MGYSLAIPSQFSLVNPYWHPVWDWTNLRSVIQYVFYFTNWNFETLISLQICLLPFSCLLTSVLIRIIYSLHIDFTYDYKFHTFRFLLEYLLELCITTLLYRF